MGQASPPISEKVHITCNDDVCGGKPCIAGTRLRVQDIYVWHEIQGKGPDEIVSAYPQLTLADVYAALAYFWDHRDLILQHMRQEEQLAETTRAVHPSKMPVPPGVA